MKGRIGGRGGEGETHGRENKETSRRPRDGPMWLKWRAEAKFMRNDKSPGFSQILCSAQSVRAGFSSHRPTQFWWKLILLLHGKPVSSSLSQAQRIQRVADGFRFYAWLYRVLSIIFLFLAPAFLVLNVAESDSSSAYWAAVSLQAAIYLWCVSGLGYSGARSYATGQSKGTSSLVAFMVMIVVFLSMFVAAASVIAHHAAWLPVMPNLAAASTLLVFGVGSYMIEIIYLATERE